jgi:hypothetical protein
MYISKKKSKLFVIENNKATLNLKHTLFIFIIFIDVVVVAFKPSTHGQLVVVEENWQSRNIESKPVIPLRHNDSSSMTMHGQL